jgi:hypothetical protein
MRLHEITNTPGDYLLTDFQVAAVIDELLQSVAPVNLAVQRGPPAVSRDRTRVARPPPDLLPD